jgi:2-dehydro-3-deoxygluconokinase
MAELITFGEPLMEFARLAEEDRPLFLQGYGGDTSNVAVAAARQGASVAVLARVGRDAFGDAFVALWRGEGIDVALVQRDDVAPTGVYFIDYGEEGHRFSYMRAGSAATRLGPDLLPRDDIANARMLHVSGITQAISTASCDAVFAAIDHARENGVPVAYDPNLRLKLWPLDRARAIALATAAKVDYLLPSEDDAATLLGVSDRDALVDALLDRGARHVVLKLGADGALVADADGREHVPAHPVEAVDATGAGDTFDGAFLTRILAGDEPVEAARHAVVAAALSTKGHGAVAPMPTRDAVEAARADQGAESS